jgi:Fic family protein
MPPLSSTQPQQGRAGGYVRQRSGYRAFIPSPLPPAPPVEMDGPMQVLLSQADVALGRLDGSIQTLPNPDLFTFMYVRKEAVLSSQIEGTQSSLQDVLAAEARILSPRRLQEVQEVSNYVGAMNYGLHRLHTLPVSLRLFGGIHAELLKGTRGSHLTPGELRKSQNWIGPAGCALEDATFVLPPPHEVVKCLGDLERFIHGDSNLPLLIKIGLAHAQFETIHPFLDGNGRIGRMLIPFLLCERGVLTQPVLYISYYFKRYRQEYYDQLPSVRDSGTWESWLKFFLNGILTVSTQATDTARNILSLRESYRQLVTEHLGRTAGTGHRALDYLYENPYVTVSDIRRVIDTTYPAANNLVTRLVDCGILREITTRYRNRVFSYQPYVDLFREDDD